MTKATGKAAAAAAARTMLADRVKLVEALGEAHDQHRRRLAAVEAAKAEEEDAANAVRAAYTAAHEGGWSHTKLKAAGLEAPKVPRGRRGSPGRLATEGAAPGSDSHTGT